MSFNMDGYIDVAERIAEFREKHPEGSLRAAFMEGKPYRVETVGDQTFIVVVAYAHRTPDDAKPGMGIAWEPFPGKTPYTRDSELQNAETSAWGRAIVATLAADTKRGIASADEVRNRQEAPARNSSPAPRKPVAQAPVNDGFVWPFGKDKGKPLADVLDSSLTYYLENKKPDPASTWYQKNLKTYKLVEGEAQKRGLVVVGALTEAFDAAEVL